MISDIFVVQNSFILEVCPCQPHILRVTERLSSFHNFNLCWVKIKNKIKMCSGETNEKFSSMCSIIITTYHKITKPR